jgi:hypothetical protein
MALRLWQLLIAAVLATALGASCAAANATRAAAGSGGQGGTHAGTGGAGTAGGHAGSGGGALFDASNDAPACAIHCSGDLHDVVDCNGVVQKTCPSDQGCAAGACVPACQSAVANESTAGCEYYAQEPDPAGSGACYAAFIVNTWNAPVTIGVELAGQPLDITKFARVPTGSGQSLTFSPLPGGQLPAGQVAVLFLSNAPQNGGNLFPCPSNIGGAVPPHIGANVVGTAIGDAYHVTTSAPVAAYDIYPWGGGPSAVTSATLLLPTSAWDTNYVAVSAWEWQPPGMPFPALQIVAAQDGTKVTINPTVDIPAGQGVAGTTKGVPVTYALNKGQILELEEQGELNGSPIQADKPIGVWVTNGCVDIPMSNAYCDSIHQQIPPVRLLGSEYVGVRYRQRSLSVPEETPPWLVMGIVDGTTLSYEPSIPPGAPTSLDAGQTVKFNAAGPFVVRSQGADHPLYVAAYMTGCGTILNAAPMNPEGCPGDPEFVNVIPTAEYLTRYIFFTDPTYPETDLVLVRQKGADAQFHDVTLDCAGVLTAWNDVGSSGNYQYARVDLVRGDFVKQGNCDNGRHEIHSDAPFALTVWGWGTAATGTTFSSPTFSQSVSYAYPAGQGVAQINTVVVPITK